MSEYSRVIWSEGMFLRPQHFQQHDRYLETFIRGRCRDLRSHAWGVVSLRLDHGLLAVGKMALLECRGLFPDGTPFDLPDDDNLPLALDVPLDVRDEIVYLALPARRPDSVEIDSEGFEDGLARFRVGDREVRDHNSGTDGRYPVQVGQLKTRLMLQRDERAGYVCLGIARIAEVRADKTVVLDEQYVPPALRCFSEGVLGRFLRELYGMLQTRGEELAGRVTAAGRGAVAEVSDFTLLQVINRQEPLFQHFSTSEILHPEDLFRLALQLAGELSTFFRPNRRPTEFPVYDHEDLQGCFTPLMGELRDLLSKVRDPHAIAIPLQNPRQGIYGAVRPELNILDNSVFVLAVNAQMPAAALQAQFPLQVKIAPVEKMQQLVLTQLPGIPIQPLPVAPRQIPFHVGFSYFELNQNCEMWKELRQSGGFAFHIGGNFPGLELEFWAIRKA